LGHGRYPKSPWQRVDKWCSTLVTVPSSASHR
jgi:hypothetical protein